MRICKKCGGSNLNSRKACKDCRAAYMREWNARNPDKVKASKKRRNPESVKAERVRHYRKCKPKRQESQRRSVEKNKEHYNAYKKAWYRANKERMLKSCKEAAARRKAADPEGERRKRAAYAAKRRKENPQYLIYGRMSALIRQHLKKKGRDPKSKAGRQWPGLVGYTLEQLTEHLRTTIPAGYTWDDYLSGRLEVDHIIPDKDFRYCTVDDPDFKTCWALSNLRLLPKEENSYRRYAER